MGIIFFLSQQSGDTLQLPSFLGADKVAHMAAYGGLALTLLWYHGEKGPARPTRTVYLTVLFCILYGVSDEYHQSFIPLRSVSILDLLADTVGALGMSLIWLVSLRLQRYIVSCQLFLVECLSKAK